MSRHTVPALVTSALAGAALVALLLVIWCPVGARWQWAATAAVLLLAAAVVGGNEIKGARAASAAGA